MKKFAAIILTVAIMLGCAMPAQASVFATYDDAKFQTYDINGLNADVEAKRKVLEEKYYINIRYDTDPDGSANIGTGSLAILDNTLAAITPEVVRQLSAYYENRLGQRLTYYFIYSPFQRMNLSYDVLGSFDYTTAVIELYLPSRAGGVYMSGDGPLTVAHEFGHAYLEMWTSFYGRDKFEREWTAMNGGYSYYGNEGGEIYDPNTFASLYGATTYEEDFAEVFAHAFTRNKAGMGMYDTLVAGGKWTNLGKKVNYLEKMLGYYLNNTETAVSNYKRAYETPVSIQYENMVFSGDYLQYMGCAQPRYILRGMMSAMGMEIDGYEWILELGGWRVVTSSGLELIIFPGGRSFRLNSARAA